MKTGAGGRPRVLVFAYACEPGRGSEPGAGWGLVRTVATFARCVVLVGPEHLPGIEAWQADNPGDPTCFVSVPEPGLGRFAKHHRISWFLLYLAWLRAAHRIGQQLHRAQPFDLVFHATYSVYWLPSPVVRYGTPCVWGPVGGAVTTPVELWRFLGWRGVVGELLDLVAVRAFSLLPSTRATWRGATVRLVQNDTTMAQLPGELRSRSGLLNHALLTEVPAVPVARRGAHLLFVSPLEARKGPLLALEALSYTPEDVRLVVVGDGPERGALEARARRLNIAHRVDFRGWVPRAEVLNLLARAAAVVFTGLREEGGIALAEALLCGAPVVVLATGGARTVALSATDPGRVALVYPSEAASTARRMAEAMTAFVRAPMSGGPLLDHGRAVEALRRAFDEALVGGLPPQ